MAKGISLHIGLNRVDPKHYDGWDGALVACESDANDMMAIAKRCGFKPTRLLTKQATSKKVIDAITTAAKQLRSGDIFLLTYAGHGGQVPDRNGDEREDGLDETCVLFDRELVDDELYALWGRFERGVRICMVSDSCHSGSQARGAVYRSIAPSAAGEPRFRAMPKEIETRTYNRNKKLYDGIQAAHPSGERVAVGASVLLISGCQDNQLSSDGDSNGLFTGTLKTVWKSGAFKGSYAKFHRDIQRLMPPWQSPNLFRTGMADAGFERQIPFTI